MVCPPLWWCWVEGACAVPPFAPNTHFLLLTLQKGQLGFLSFCIFWSKICSNCTCPLLSLVPYSFFVFCVRGEVCPDLSTAANSPRSQARLSKMAILLVHILPTPKSTIQKVMSVFLSNGPGPASPGSKLKSVPVQAAVTSTLGVEG